MLKFSRILLIGFLIVVSLAFGYNLVKADGELRAPVYVALPVTLEDVLVRLHTGQWFGWTDSKNKNYETLLVLDKRYSKPTEVDLQVAMDNLQTALDSDLSTLNNLRSLRSGIESRFLDGSYTDQDIVNYLQLLGGF